MEKNLSFFNESFWYSETNLDMLLNYPYRMEGGFILLCTEGEAVVSVGVQKCEIVKNTEMIVLPGTTFYLLSASETFHVKILTFPKEVYDEVSLRLGVPFSSYLRETPCYTYPDESSLLKNIAVWMNMGKLIFEDKSNQFNALMLRNFIQNYLLWLYDKSLNYFEQTVGKFTRKQERYHQFMSLLDTHCREQRDALFYADKLCITLSYLRMVCHACSSFASPKEIIDKRVILEIKVLLQSTEYTIQEIAEILHFPDQSYLGRYFKRHTGMAASEYRALQKSVL